MSRAVNPGGGIVAASFRHIGALRWPRPASAPRIDHFFSAVAARLDLWRDLSRAAQAWAANPASRGDAGLQAACNEALTALLPLEDFQAYPGARVLNAIKERVAAGDALGTARLVQRVSSALMSRSYRSDAGEFEAEDDAATPERAMPAATGERGRRDPTSRCCS